jgi:hypothetical protein
VQRERESARDRRPFVSVGKGARMFRNLPEESSVSTSGDNGSWDGDFRVKKSVIVRNQPDMPLIHQ